MWYEYSFANIFYLLLIFPRVLLGLNRFKRAGSTIQTSDLAPDV
jgi:hypothetical protein